MDECLEEEPLEWTSGIRIGVDLRALTAFNISMLSDNEEVTEELTEEWLL